MGALYLLGLFALSIIIIYFVGLRPITQREKQHDRMVDELEVGDMVITAGGIYGTVDTIAEDSIVLKVESGATIRVTKGGVLKRNE